MHIVKWDWCHSDKLLGGLGLKDLKLQGIALAAKWIFHSMDGNDLWKILVRNNIERGFPKNAKSWKNLPFNDLIIGNFPIVVQGSVVFRSIWKAWSYVRKYITIKDFHDDNQLYGERSIWWNLHLSGKPLTLSQGYSARYWSNMGISQLTDLFEHDRLINWIDLRSNFDIPASQKKTYNMILKAIKDMPTTCHVDSHRYLNCKWLDGNILSKIKAKNIYKVIGYNDAIIYHVNFVWYSSLGIFSWKKYFGILWKGSVEHKIKCLKWLLLLDRFPIRKDTSVADYCNLCRLLKLEDTFSLTVFLLRKFGICLVSLIL